MEKKYEKKAHFGKENPFFGKKHSPETREKMRQAKLKNKVSGKRHWNWKGGITTESRYQRTLFKKTMQHKVFERDGYKCVLCGSGSDLQVDHIQRWSEFEELRFSMDNCRTICAKCHYLITFQRPMPDDVHGWGHNLLKGGNIP